MSRARTPWHDRRGSRARALDGDPVPLALLGCTPLRERSVWAPTTASSSLEQHPQPPLAKLELRPLKKRFSKRSPISSANRDETRCRRRKPQRAPASRCAGVPAEWRPAQLADPGWRRRCPLCQTADSGHSSGAFGAMTGRSFTRFRLRDCRRPGSGGVAWPGSGRWRWRWLGSSR